MAASYSVLSSGLYTIPRAEVLYRIWKNGVAISGIQQFGDVDKFTLSFTPSVVERYRKNARVRTKAARIVNQIDSAVAFTCYQFSQALRMMSILGAKMPYSQTSGSATYTEKATVGIHYVGHQEISAVSPTPLDTETWTAGTNYRVVDPELGAFEILELPVGVTEDDEITWGYTKAAITEGSRMKAKIGADSQITLELWVRDVGANSIPQVLYLPQVEVSPAGEVPFIGEDDFSSIEFSGSALDTTEGLGFLLDLAA
ncbi:hypothetical protein AWN88_22555 [Agrobacterium tumefaciens]|nr:hypothetical protein AWN88_22555 [Agrobacterium tumefaciens]KAJ35065.1 hypothetical protein BW45_00180 [Agrobacterium tumefaciens]